MKKRQTVAALMVAVGLLLAAATGGAQPAADADSPGSPYFLINSDSLEVDRLPLKSTIVEVTISGVIADVTVRQVYTNAGRRPIEALYIFPAATRAAVYAMRMQVGKRTIVAKIEAREAARRIYEQARQSGQRASLLEQQRPNVFQMNVANILPGDEIAVELRYTELLVPVDGIYHFIYPTVVGPRYTGGERAGETDAWARNPYLRPETPPSAAFDISVSIQAGLPIQDIACDSHPIRVHYPDARQATVALSPSPAPGADRDFILKYRLNGAAIQTGLLLYEGQSENFFLAMLQPPRRVAAEGIPAREYVFIVDVSGSMHGFPLEISKQLMADLIGGLRPSDRFNVLLFAGGSQLMSPRSIPATPANIRRAMDLIDRQQGGGGTELLPALERALSLPRGDGVARCVVMVTDGYVTVETEAFDLIRRRLGEATMIPFGIGSSVNRFLIEGLARVGMGEPFVVTDPARAKQAANRFRKLIATPVMTDVHLDFGQFDVYDVEPPALPDLLAERPVVVFGKYRGRPRGRLRITGRCGGAAVERSIDVGAVRPAAGNRALRYLWARHRIAVLTDYNRLRQDDGRAREVTELGLAYNLLTETTSFVAVDTRHGAHGGELVTVKQPLPLPAGVSELAVGAGAAGAVRMQKLAAPVPATAPLETRESSSARRQVAPRNGSAADKAETGIDWVVTAVRAPGMSETALRTILETHLATTDRCPSGVAPPAGAKINLRLSVGADGRIRGVEAVDAGNRAQWRQCLENAFAGLYFPIPENSRGLTVEVTLAARQADRSGK